MSHCVGIGRWLGHRFNIRVVNVDDNSIMEYICSRCGARISANPKKDRE